MQHVSLAQDSLHVIITFDCTYILDIICKGTQFMRGTATIPPTLLTANIATFVILIYTAVYFATLICNFVLS